MSLRVKARSRVIDVLLTAALAVAGSLPAFATETHQFDVPAEDAPSAIREFAAQAHVQILVAGENVKDKHLHSVSGEFSTDQGLRLLLADSGLSPKYVGERAIALVTSTDAMRANPGNAKEGKSNSSQDFRLAQMDQGASGHSSISSATQNSINNESGGTALTEIIVTAQKRNERLQDVPVPVSAISADALISSNQLRLQDYYTRVPGLSVTPDDLRGAPVLSIRGITTGVYTNPTVGITVDDVPYGSTTSAGGGSFAPDLDPSDLARVEVLRGPQGTLYGANSIGGLLKFVTVDPSTEALSGRIEADGSGVRNGDGLGYGFRGAVNVPISDTFAIRASGFTRHDPGYIDNELTGERGVNWAETYGGRFAALWRPSDQLSIKLSALYQDGTTHGSNDVIPALGEFDQSAVRGTGYAERKAQVYSAVLTAKLGISTLTSVTGYSINQFSDSVDYTALLGPYTLNGIPGTGFNGFGVSGTPLLEDIKTNKFTQEVRLATPIGNSLEWLVGAFYEHESSSALQVIDAADSQTGAIAGFWASFDYPTTYTEYAAFTDLTWNISDQFDVQFGARESQNRQTYSEVDTGPYVTLFEGFASPLVNPEVRTKDNSFTYLVTPRFKISPDLMVYTRLASGYRPGGPNLTCIVLKVPCEYAPDKTNNYEIGLKGDAFEHSLSFDASLYYSNWKDIQLPLIDPTTGFNYFANASRAKSQGVELSVEVKPLAGLLVGAWVAFNDAKLTANLPANSAAGSSGDRLPDSSRFSADFTAQQEFPLTANVIGFVGGDLSYTGNRLGVFIAPPSPPTRQTFPGYAKIDLQSGARIGSLTTSLFVKNAADRHAPLNGGIGTAPNPEAFNFIQPRTIGISLSKTF